MNILMLFAGIGFMVFGHSFFYDFFVFDDLAYVIKSHLLQDISLSRFFETWQYSRTPIVYNFWQVVVRLFGTESAFPFRLANIVFHILNTFGLFVVARLLVKKVNPLWIENRKDITFALASACILFLVHPIQAESIIWISAFKGTLATFFGLISILSYLLSRETGIGKKTRNIFITISFIAYISGLLCKPSIVTIPILYFAGDFFLFKIKGLQLALYNFGYIVSVQIVGLIHMLNPAQSSGVIKLALQDKAILILEALRFSVLKIFIPINYSFDYQLSPINILAVIKGDLIGIGWSIVAFYLILSFLILYLLHKKKHLVLCGIFTFLTLYLVNSGLISFIFQNISTVANRYLYFPLMGLCLVLVSLIYLCLEKHRVLTKILTIVLLFILGARGIHEGYKWKSSYELLKHGHALHSNSYALNMSLGSIAFENKDYKNAQDFFEAAYENGAGQFYNESYARLIQVYGHTGEMAKAHKMIEDFKSIVSDTTGEIDTAILRYYFDSRQYLLARDYIPRAEHYTGKNPPRAHEVGVIKEQLQRIFSSTNQEAYRQLGMEHYNRGEYSKAKTWIDIAVKLRYEKRLDRFARYLNRLVKEEKKKLRK
ncbi:MAG: hypothetical protein KAG61_13825 [Bacteriovoracaceae bacterium]|nr:hypothetical protein [Bacteriovoracaceae bacterium]